MHPAGGASDVLGGSCGQMETKRFFITHVSILHGSDVRSEARVSWSQDGLHARIQLI